MFEKVVTIDDIKKHISFEGKSSALFEEEKSIPNLQTQGVTALCKILKERQYAYLADEVGMGKTYQAIGVIVMLLAEKPDANILVITPNQNVQNNWYKEIESFNEHNLIKKESKINAKIHYPLDLIYQYINDEESISSVNIVRLSSFSCIGQTVARKSGKSQYLNSDGEISKEVLLKGIKNYTGKTPYLTKSSYDTRDAGIICGICARKCSPHFDLVIVDEAQNIKNENNATTFLSNWLGLRRFREKEPVFLRRRKVNPSDELELRRFREKEPVFLRRRTVNPSDGLGLRRFRKWKQCDSKFLLMSATPAHRGIESLKDQLRYFDDDPIVNHTTLQQFLIRRLRTYRGENRYSVRNVTAENVLEKADIRQYMFLALIQSRLARIKHKNNSTFKIGFLETFESYDISSPKQQDDEESSDSGKEFENGIFIGKDEKGAAADKKMLTEIAKSYAKKFRDSCPPHPKLSYMENEIENLMKEKKNFNNNDLSSDDYPNKALVFVRRLASVDELVSERLGKKYEDAIVQYWRKKFNLTGNSKLNSIKRNFENLYNSTLKNTKSIEDEDNESQPTNEIQTDEEEFGELRKWMKQQKNSSRLKFSAVSRFKKSLAKNRSNSFLFDENYLRTSFMQKNTIKDYNAEIEKQIKNNISEKVCQYISADKERYITHSKQSKLKKSDLLPLCCYVVLKGYGDSIADDMQNFFGFVEPIADKPYEKYIDDNGIRKLLKQQSIWNMMPLILADNLNCFFKKQSFAKREAIKSWIEKYLKQSEVILEILYAYCQKSGYIERCKEISKYIFNKNNSCFWRIKKLLENSELVCNQLLGSEKIDYKYDPKFMNNQSWVVGAIGGNQNNGDKIRRFNTPFYPDVIVCTDVFKEGINLHLFCNRVYHYGLAWTPGDLEQRIGRVDRFFSQTHRARMKGNDDVFINVTYPYMGMSIDEQQLKKVLKFKVSADPLMDLASEEKTIDSDFLETATVKELAGYKPDEDLQTNFPYSGEAFLN